MGAIVAFLTSILDTIKGFFQHFIQFFQIIGKAIHSLGSYLCVVPAPLYILVISCIAIAVIMRILGREG